MKGDFTRTTYRKRNHYSRVLMQQGRVQLDADWNEQLAIDAHVDRTVRRDVIGYCGGPQGNDPDGNPLAGFDILASGVNLSITAGRYYVNGILVENDAERLFTQQPDLRNAALPTTAGTYLIYLDVWERHITALEDSNIREVALGGPDTATRARVMAQVKWESIESGANCNNFGPGWTPVGAASTGRLAARSAPEPPSTDPCIMPEEAGYRRLENQLYRVEIHNAGSLNGATFKWSRENGSIVTRWLSQDGDHLTVSSAGRDAVLGFANQQWVELTDEIREQAGTPGTLVMIDSVEGNVITIDTSTATGSTSLANFDTATAKIRRWDSDGAATVTVPATNNGWIPLEDGVEVKFKAGTFCTGDYWLIPARTLLGDVQWDTEAGTGPQGFQLRHGIHHAYCPLAIGSLTGNGWGELTDCRHLFPPLTEIDRGNSCCTVTVGDGVLSAGDFSTIQDAVDSLEESGTVCILPGVYQLQQPVVIRELDIVLTGCGRQTAIIAAGSDPALVIEGGRADLNALSIRASSAQGAVVANQLAQLTVKDCSIVNGVQRETPVGVVALVDGATNRVPNRANTNATRLSASEASAAPTAANRYARTVIGRVEATRIVDLRRPALVLRRSGPALSVVAGRYVTIQNNQLSGMPAIVMQATIAHISDNALAGGGVWIADGSADVTIQNNDISRGQGPGVVLGGIPPTLQLSNQESGVGTVFIVDNTITGMQGSGVSSVIDVEQNLDLGELEDIHIRQNLIRHCALAGPDPVYDPIAVGGIVLRQVTGLVIADNLITDNGGAQVPACGIFTFMCNGLEVTNNHIADNGTTAARSDTAETCVDFEAQDEGEGEGPFESDIASFASVGFDGQPVGYEIQAVGNTRGLNCRTQTVITLVSPTEGVRVRIRTGSRAVVLATRADGTETTQTFSSSTSPQEAIFSGPEIIRVTVNAPQNETWLLTFCTTASNPLPDAYQAGVAALYVVGGQISDPTLSAAGITYQTAGPAALIHDNVIVCPRGQSVILAGVGPMSISGNTLTSQGVRVQPQVNETDIFSQLATLGPGVFVYNLGRTPGLGQAAAGIAAAGTLNFNTTARLRAAVSARSQFPDGRTLFHGNQVTLEILQNAPRFVPSCAALVSFDDVSIQDNQVLTQIIGGAVFASVAALGITVRAGDNRIHELPNQALASYLSQAVLNSATGNQGTHCIVVRGAQVIDDNNQEAITTHCEALNNLNAPVTPTATVGVGHFTVNRAFLMRRG